MITLGLAFIQWKSGIEFGLLYMGTLIIDYQALLVLGAIVEVHNVWFFIFSWIGINNCINGIKVGPVRWMCETLEVTIRDERRKNIWARKRDFCIRKTLERAKQFDKEVRIRKFRVKKGMVIMKQVKALIKGECDGCYYHDNKIDCVEVDCRDGEIWVEGEGNETVWIHGWVLFRTWANS